MSPLGGLSPGQTPPRVQSPPGQGYGQFNELGGENRVNELGGENRGSWNTPLGVQELGAGGNASGGIPRRPVNTRGNFDLSGAPMSEEYRHELQ